MIAPVIVRVVRDQNAGAIHLRFEGADGELAIVPLDDTKTLYDGLHSVAGTIGEVINGWLPSPQPPPHPGPPPDVSPAVAETFIEVDDETGSVIPRARIT